MTDTVLSDGAPTVVLVPDVRVTVVQPEPVSVVLPEPPTTVVVPGEVIVVNAGTGPQGIPGPPGVPGPPGDGTSRIEFDVEAGFNISAYQVICPRMLDDSVRIASNDIASHADRPLWLAVQSALTGETLRAVSSGRVDNSGWDWVQAPIYLGVGGVMTQTPPAIDQGALFSAQLGYAINETSMFFDRFTPITLA